MIGKILPPPLIVQATASGGVNTKTWQHSPGIGARMTGIKNAPDLYHSAYSTLPRVKELLLFRQVSCNKNLSVVSGIDRLETPEKRFISFGLAISILARYQEAGASQKLGDDIVRLYHIDTSVIPVWNDPAILKRGAEAVKRIYQYISSPVIATLYAQGLRIGLDLTDNIVDPVMVKNFKQLWDIMLSPSVPSVQRPENDV